MSYPGQPPMGIPGMPPMPYMVGAPPPIIGGVMPMAHVSKLTILGHDRCVLILIDYYKHLFMCKLNPFVCNNFCFCYQKISLGIVTYEMYARVLILYNTVYNESSID